MSPASNAIDAILARFTAISRIPRPSGREGPMLAWLRAWADGQGLTHASDAAGNLCVRVPGSTGRESVAPVILQGHVDMVCEKTPESTHDFLTDPIRLVREGDWLRADGTTLGADNGIAVAMMLTLAEGRDLVHPPLELLFTVDEETGLNGARALAPEILAGRRLLNLDSEEEGVFTIGCAGGSTVTGTLPVQRAPADNPKTYGVSIGGLQGGHSGIEIHLERANALRLLVEALGEETVRLVSLNGGRASNAIPRDASTILAIDSADSAPIVESIRHRLAEIKQRWSRSEPAVQAAIHPVEGPFPDPLTPASTCAVLALLAALPHGVQAMTGDQTNQVETSTNLANASLRDHTLVIVASQRSVRRDRLEALNRRIDAVFAGHGAAIERDHGYPPWQPDLQSPLLECCRDVYRRLFNHASKAQVIHAGLECGVFAGRIPGIDMISFGPTIEHPHSPGERVHLPSVGRVWEFTVALLASLT